MKKHLLFWGFLTFVNFVSGQKNIVIALQNPMNEARTDEPIILTRKDLEKKAGKALLNKAPKFTKNTGEILPSQTDDLNGDGTWDEVIFVTNFKNKEKYTVNITFVQPEELPTLKKRTQARLAKLDGEQFIAITKETMPKGHKQTDFSTTKMPLYQTEGPAWENDKVGFRLYFDPRNGKDIFGKTTSDLVLHKVGLPGGNYHVKSDWGMDVLKVGASLGAGALALQVTDYQGKTTLARLGDNVEQTTYELVSDGVVRSIFRLHYKNWQPTPGEKYNVMEEIHIIAGQYYIESKVTINGLNSEKYLVTGIANLLSQKALQFEGEKYGYLATHDTQSENKDKLGMGIVFDKTHFAGFGETPKSGSEKVLQTYFIKLKMKDKQPVAFKFYAAWEATDQRFKDAGYFETFLQSEIKRFSQPIQVKGKGKFTKS